MNLLPPIKTNTIIKAVTIIRFVIFMFTAF
jgi:hypothetical protein